MPTPEPALRWPSLEDPHDGPSVRRRRGWRETWTAAADLALLGIVTVAVSAAVLTAGGAVATASAAVHHWGDTGDLPPVRELLRRLRRAVLPGIGPGLFGVGMFALLLLNASAIARGVVPGGPPLLVATVVVSALVLGYAGLTVVEVGRAGGTGWWAAMRRAWATSAARPWVPATLGAVIGLAGFLGLALPVCAPLLVGYLMLALHAVTRRLA